MSEANDLHTRMFETVLARDFDGLRNLFHPDYVYIGPDGAQGGSEESVAVADTYTSAFADFQIEFRTVLDCGEGVSVLELTVSGTHEHELEGIAPTHKRVTMPGCNIIEVRDGKIYREQDYFDELAIMRQLGVMPAHA